MDELVRLRKERRAVRRPGRRQQFVEGDDAPVAEDGDGSWWQDEELRRAWCDEEFSCAEDESDEN